MYRNVFGKYLTKKFAVQHIVFILVTGLLCSLLAACGKEKVSDGAEQEREQNQAPPRQEFLWQEQSLAAVEDYTDGSPIYIVDYQGDLDQKPDFSYDWGARDFYGQVNDKIYVFCRYRAIEPEESKKYLVSYDLNSKERQCTELDFDIPEFPYFYPASGEVIGEDEIVFFYPYNGVETVEKYYAVYTNAQGRMIRMQDIYPALKEFGVELEPSMAFDGMVCDGRGYLYVCDPSLPRVGVIDEKGALIDTMEVIGSYDGGPVCSMRSPEGIPIFELRSTSESNSTYFWYDPEKAGMRILTKTAYMGMSAKCMNKFGEIYFCLMDKIIRWDGASGERERIFDCKSNGLGANSFLLKLLTDSEGGLFLLDFSNSKVCLYEFSDQPVEGTSNITIANIWGIYDDDLRACAASFSRQNPSCHVECEKPDMNADYSDRQAYRDRVIADLVAGKGPEMLLVDGNELKLLYEKGALADLSDVFPTETKEQIFSSVLEAGSFDGKLIGLAGLINGACMETVFVSKDVWTKDTWTVEELVNLVEEREGELESIFVGGFYSDNPFYCMAMRDLENTPFIDWEKKECYFDGELFRKVLELSMKYSNTSEGRSSSGIIDYDVRARNEREAIQSGKALAYVDNYINTLYFFSKDVAMLGEDYFYVGFPTGSGNGNYFYATNTYLVVNKSAENMDVIYQFIQYAYNKENQRSMGSGTVRKDVLSSYVVYPDWTTGAEFSQGNGIYEPLDCKPDGTSYLEEYLEFVESCVRQPPGTDEIMSIIMEETSGYFEGGKDIDRTVEAIQRRVQLYLDEHK